MSKKKDKNARKKQVNKRLLAQKQKTLMKENLPLQSNVSAFDDLDYEVTFEPLYDGTEVLLPDDVVERKEYIYHHLREDAASFIDELEVLTNTYPQDTTLTNFLSNAYKLVGQSEKYIEYSLATFEANPDYLFGRFQLGLIYIEQKEFVALEKLFDGKFDLKEFCPERSIFHISEVESMLSIAVQYYEHIEDYDKFLACYDVLRQYDPMSPITLKVLPMVLKLRLGLF